MAPIPGDSSKHQFCTSMPQGGHPPHHSITSSARASKLSGTSRPRALAVLRLITASYFTGLAPAAIPEHDWACRQHPKTGNTCAREALVRLCRGHHLSVSAGHVKKPDLLRMRPVEHMDRLGGGLQYYLAALLREISLSLRR